MTNKVEIEIIAKGLTEVKKSLNELEKELKKVQGSALSASEQIKFLGKIRKHALIATTAIGGLGAVTAKLAIDFNKSFGMVQTLIGTSTEKAKYFKKELLGLSNSYGVSLKDLSDGLYEVISAFGESVDNVKQLEVATKAAKAGGASTVESIKLLSAVTKGYGDISQEAMQKVSDLSFQVVKDGQTTFPELASSLGRVVPTASSLGISLEELMAVFSTSTGVIGGASEVSTKFQAALVGMTKPTQELQEIYNQLGIASGDALIQQKGFAGALNTIKKVADKNSQSIDKYFGSVEAGNIALLMTGSQADVFAQKLENMHQATGATNEAFTSLSEGTNAFQTKLEKASTQLQNFGIKIGEELIPRLNDSLQGVFAFIEGLSSMDKETLALIVDIGEILLVIGGMTTAVMTAQKAWLALCVATKAQTIATVAQTVAQKALNFVMSLNPIGAILIGLTSLVAILLKVTKWTNASAEAWAKQNSELGKIQEKLEKTKESHHKLCDEMQKLIKEENTSVTSKEQLAEKIDSLIRKYPRLTEEIIRNAIAHNNLNEVLSLQSEVESLQEEKEKLEEISKELESIKDKSSGISLADFLKQVQTLGGDDLLEKVQKSLTKGFLDMNFLQEIREKLGKDFVKSFIDLKNQVAQKIYKEMNGKQRIVDLLSLGFFGDRKKISLKQAEDMKFFSQLTKTNIDKMIEVKNKNLEKLFKDNQSQKKITFLSADEPIKVTDEEFNKLKMNIEKNIRELNIKINQAEKDIYKARESLQEAFFTPISIGDDPWGFQKVLDLTGELAFEINNQIKRVSDGFNRTQELILKEQEKCQLESFRLFQENDLKSLEEAGENKNQIFEKIAQRQIKTIQKGSQEVIQNLQAETAKISQETQKEMDKAEKKRSDQLKRATQRIATLTIQLSGALAKSSLKIFQNISENNSKSMLLQLDELENTVNQKIKDYQEERQAQEEQIREERKQREQEESLQEIERNIGNLQAQFDSSISIKKRAEIAEELEEANKRKAQEKRRQEEENAEKERQKQEKLQLFEFEMEKYKIEVDRINKENEMAESDKKQKIAQVWIDYATSVATAWASSANPLTFWFGGVFTALMTGIATAQTAAISSQNVKKPIPSEPKPPKLREGGIVKNQGKEGTQAIIGDGVSEAILPLEEKTFQSLAKAIIEQMSKENAQRQADKYSSLTFTIENNLNINQNITAPYNAKASAGFENEEDWREHVSQIFKTAGEDLVLADVCEKFFLDNSRFIYNSVKDHS